MLRGLSYLPLTLILLIASGCHRAEEEAPDDEAMVRARKEGKAPETAAREWFYPQEIQDYFPGMDPIVVRQTAPVDQLLDVALQQAQNDPAPPSPATPPAAQGTPPPAPAMQVGHVVVEPDLNESEILGRNTWMIWAGGNEGFWDWLATEGFGFVDLLKLVDSRNRTTRFRDAGMINEPEMAQAGSPSEKALGLWLDRPTDDAKRKWQDAYLDEVFRGMDKKGQTGGGYGATGGDSRGGTYGSTGDASAGGAYGSGAAAQAYEVGVPPPGIYGISSGIVGLRLFPNPKFLESKEAQEHWDGERYYNDPSYYNDPGLIRPFRVGMSCAFCHASYHPLTPPRDLLNPQWSNISGNIGAQYLRIRAVFGNLLKPDNFVYHILDSQPPGTIDTSLIASDNINNPNTMNSIFGVPERVVRSFLLPKEQLSAVSASQPSVWGNVENPAAEGGYGASNGYSRKPLTEAEDVVPPAYRALFEQIGLGEELRNSNAALRPVPRILLDGSDSVGAWVALARVYLNIGTYYERWNQLHNPLVGITPQRPFKIDDCRAHSVYWHATQLRVGPMRDYFLKVTPPMPLLAVGQQPRKPTKAVEAAAPPTTAPQEAASEASVRALNVGVDVRKLARGREVFAKNCIVCHSSLQPETLHVDAGGTADAAKADGFAAARAALMVKPEEAATFAKTHAEVAKRRHDALAAWAANGEFWDHNPGQWLSDPAYQQWATAVVEQPAFWKNNYLSTDYRVPINLVRTNAGRAMATNALTGNMWQDYASTSYRTMPSVGAIDFYNPYPWVRERDRSFLGKKYGSPFIDKGEGLQAFTPLHKAPEGAPAGGGGPGFYRVPTLISIWSTAPLLHNNSLGLFTNDPSLEGRLAAFDDAIRKLLWPERRLLDSSYNGATAARLKADRGLIWRTLDETYLDLPAKYAPAIAGRAEPVMIAMKKLYEWFPSLQRPAFPLWLPSAVLLVASFLVLLFAVKAFLRWLGYGLLLLALLAGFIVYFQTGGLGDVRIGPIPKGTPVNLIANVNPDVDQKRLKKTVHFVISKLAEIDSKNLDEKDAQKVLREQVAPALMEVSKCPDFVMDQGHYYEWFKEMSDEDKEALIHLLKTF